MQKRIIIASDHRGFLLKKKLMNYLYRLGFKAKDLGTYSEDSCDYPDFAYSLAKEISQKKYSRGILICYSGIGNSIIANRFPGVRAALCYNAETARLSREHNDSNVLVLGSGFVSETLARRILAIWLKARFLGGRHRRRLDKIKEIEKEMKNNKL